MATNEIDNLFLEVSTDDADIFETMNGGAKKKKSRKGTRKSSKKKSRKKSRKKSKKGSRKKYR